MKLLNKILAYMLRKTRESNIKELKKQLGKK